MSGWGQKRQCSDRAEYFRFAPNTDIGAFYEYTPYRVRPAWGNDLKETGGLHFQCRGI